MIKLPNPLDLLHRKAENELWISESYLLQLLPALSADYLRVKARPAYKQSVLKCYHKNTFLPDTGKAWRFSKQKGTFYYEFDSVPDKAPSMYRSQLPLRSELIELIKTVKQQQAVTPLEEFLNPYLNQHYISFLPEYGECTKQQQTNLSKAAATLKAACDYIQENNIDFHKTDFFKAFTQLTKDLQLPYCSYNHRYFKGQCEAVLKHHQTISTVIKLPRSQNNNAAKHSEDKEVESWITQMRMMGENYTNEHIIRKVKWMCQVCDKPIPSDRWIGSVMETHNHKWLTANTRFGSKGRHGQMYRGYIPGKNAMFAGDCWQVDGTRVNLIDFKLSDKNVFLYVVAVRDVHSGDVLGYSFDISENRWTVINALKMAVEEAGYLPYQIMFDRFPGHNTPEAENLFNDLKAWGTQIMFGHTATAKAKLERWFSTMQQVFMQDSKYYYGEGIMSRNKFAHRSKEYLQKVKSISKQEGWDFDKASDEAGQMIERYRNTPVNTYSRKFQFIDKAPAALHSDSEKPNVTIIQDFEILYLFGLRTQCKIKNEGIITLQIQNYPFVYRCTDAAIISKYDRVTVCYDLEDLSTIHLYEISDKKVLKTHLGVARETTVQLYGPDAEWGKINEQKAVIKSLTEERQRQLNMKLAAGDEVSILLQGVVDKHSYENADAEITIQNLGLTESDSIDDYDVRNQYS